MIFLQIQRMRRICPKPIVFAALLTLTTSACATSRMGEAEVRQLEGVPCFTIPEKEEQSAGGAPRLIALSVYDITVSPSTEIWSFTSKLAQKPPISSGACILYGQPLPGGESTKSVPLQLGRKYEVILSTERVNQTDPTFGYSARFCLAAKPGEAVRVKQVIYSKGWRYEVCQE